MTALALSPARRAWLGLAAVILVAAVARFWRLFDLPPGYWYDEAHKALVALEILRGQRFPLYITDTQGFDSGFFWLLAGWFRLFGPAFHAPRVLSAILGTLTVPLTYAALRALYRDFPYSRTLALVSAAWLAVLLWHIHGSRLGFETIAVPMFAITLLGLVAWAWRQRSARLFLLVGVVLGLSQYTYPGARVLPLQVGLTFLALASGPRLERLKFGLLLAASALVIYLPLGLFFVANPEWFFNRISFVSTGARAGGLPAILSNVARTLLSLNFSGDPMVRHNLASRPAYDPIASLCFLGGLWALWHWRLFWRPHLAFLAAFGVNLLPTLFSDGAPSFSRALGATPFVAVLPAWGVIALLHRWPRQAWSRLLAAALVGLSATLNLSDYFIRYPRQPGLFDAYGVGLWTLTQSAWQAAGRGTGYLILTEPERADPATRFTQAIAAGDLRLINAEACLAYPAVVTAPTTIGALSGLENQITAEYPAAPVIVILHEPEPYPYAVLINLPLGAQALSAAQPAIADFGGSLALAAQRSSASVVQSGDTLTLTLRWLARQPIEVPYHVFVHLANPEAPFLAGADAEPCAPVYPMTAWHSNEYIEHHLPLSVPPSLAPGAYRLMVGVYNWQTGERLPLTQPGAIEPDRAYIADLMVQP